MAELICQRQAMHYVTEGSSLWTLSLRAPTTRWPGAASPSRSVSGAVMHSDVRLGRQDLAVALAHAPKHGGVDRSTRRDAAAKYWNTDDHAGLRQQGELVRRLGGPGTRRARDW